jgi:malonyl CoA-acyl carrier protein transacylase/4'-phosphopantetheinyl transferase EntD
VKEPLHRLWPDELIVLQGDTRTEILDAAAALCKQLRANPDSQLTPLAATLALQGQGRRAPLAVVASSAADLDRKLTHAIERLADPNCTRVKERAGVYYLDEPLSDENALAFIFPGEGAQYSGMLADVCLHFPAARHWFDVADRVCARRGREPNVGDVVFSGINEPEELWSLDLGAAAVFAANQAMLAVVRKLKLQPAAIVGHSTGDYSALCASGALVADEESIVAASCTLAETYERVRDAGTLRDFGLIAVAAPDTEAIARVLDSSSEVAIALDNCPNQVVLACPPNLLERTTRTLAQAGAVCTPLAFGRAYHTPAFDVFAQALKPFVDSLELRPPDVPLWSCATAAPYPSESNAMRRVLIEQWTSPVRFRETIEALYQTGIRIFVEVGPRGNLSAFVSDVLRKRPHLACASNVHSRSGLSQLAHFVGLLASHGVPVAVDQLFSTTACEPLPQPAPPVTLTLPGLAMPARRTSTSAAANGQTPPPHRRTPTIPIGPARHREQSAEVLDEYLRTMERFVEAQETIMAGFLGRPAGTNPTAVLVEAPPISPLLGLVLDHLPGQSIRCERQFTLASDPLLRDHTLGRDVSRRDPALGGLSVMPLTLSIELLAQAAAALHPGSVPVTIRDVRAHRWIALERGEATIRITASRSRRGEASTCLECDGAPAVEAIVELASDYPSAPPPTLSLRGQPSRWTADRLYAEGMFHGPSLRGVQSVDRWAPDGIAGTLTALPTDPLGATPLSDPILLDAAGQLIGFWSAEHEPLDVFPFAVSRIDLYNPALAAGTHASCVATIDSHEPGVVRSTLELTAQGQLHARLTGWEDRRFALPADLVELRADPAGAHLGRPWQLGCTLVDGLSDGLLDGGGGIWRSVVAHLLLSANERQEWQQLTPTRRDRWLRGRAAAKDAARLRQGDRVPPADVEIATDANGRPYLRDDPATQISIAHCGHVALAIAASGVRGIGCDIEPATPLAEDAAAAAFSDAEIQLLGADWLIRGWCAKESAAKALALAHDPLTLHITDVEHSSGRITLASAERDELLQTNTVEHDGYIAAVCRVEEGDQTR